MSEEPPKRVVDLSTLGAHIGRTIATHQDHHEQGKVSVERLRRFNELKSRVHFLANGNGLASKRSTDAYPVETLDTGTKVKAAVSNPDKSVRSAATELLGDASTDYIEKGPYSERVSAEPFASSEFDSKLLPHYNLSINLHLETPHESNNISPTRDSVWVGSVLDPESILVPEDPVEGGPEQMSVIGPLDSRFGPIMDVLAHVNEAVGPRGEQPRTS